MMPAHLALRSGRWLQFQSATTNVVMDGNSLVYGYRNPGPGNTIAQQLVSQSTSPLYGSGVTVVNLGVSGQTWTGMLSGLPVFVAGKTNILVAWEGTNAIQGGRTGAQAVDDAAAYCSAVLAANSAWKIVHMTCLPRQGGFAANWGTIAAFNAQIDAYNTQLMSEYSAHGAVAVCDIRKSGGVFDMSGDYSNASFEAVNTRGGTQIWLEATTGGAIHLTDAADGVVAGYLADTLRRVRA